ncbi:hypothetical protein V1511DRAFT_498441 [Dipodascopsis uninucleata]
MEFYDFASREDFLAELEAVLQVGGTCENAYGGGAYGQYGFSPGARELIEGCIVTVVRMAYRYFDDYMRSDEDIAQFASVVVRSGLFEGPKAIIVRRRLLRMLLVACGGGIGSSFGGSSNSSSSDGTPTTPSSTGSSGISSASTDGEKICEIAAVVALLDGRRNVEMLELLETERVGLALMQDIMFRYGPRGRRIELELMYEMWRVQRVDIEVLETISEKFIEFLFGVVEGEDGSYSDGEQDAAMRVLLVLNEQYMLAYSSVCNPPNSSAGGVNKVINTLAQKSTVCKRFGSAVIILLNRVRDASVQLLVLKFMFQVFTTKATFEYFYTNDLTVLLDVFIRELNDLPADAETLRHTYLRVLYPLLAHSQLRNAHYKRDELLRLLYRLLGGRTLTPLGVESHENSGSTSMSLSQSEPGYANGNVPPRRYYCRVSETTARLVNRCLEVSWLREDRQ